MRNTCLNMIYELAKRDERVIFIGSDLSPGLLSGMKRDFPKRYYMEGISEAHIIGMAAGLALEGYLPFVVTIASFLTRRCYEQIAIDVCLHNLPVRLIGIGGGLNYASLGPTHQAIEDIAIMRALPNMTIIAPCDSDEMTRLMSQMLTWKHPAYIRLAKGFDPIVSKKELGFEIGKAILMRKSASSDRNVLLISTGIMTTRGLLAADMLAKDGIECALVHVHTIKPLDTATIISQADKAKLVVTLEEHTVIGGLGSACADAFSEQLRSGEFPDIVRIGVADKFIDDYGTQDSLMEEFGLQPSQIAERIKKILKNK